MKYQIQEYEPFRQQMAELQNICNFLPDTTTTEGYDKSKRLALDGRKAFNALESARKVKKADILETGRLIDSECKEIQGQISQAINPHLVAYKEVDNRERIRKEELDRSIDSRIEAFRNCVYLGSDMDSSELAEMIDDLKADPMEDCYHRATEALKVRNAVVATLTDTLTRKKAEDEERELEAERQRQRDIEVKAEAERLETQRIAQAATQKELDEANAKVRLEQKAAQTALDEQQSIVAARERKVREAEEEREKQEYQARVEQEAKDKAEREAAETQAKAEQEAVERSRQETAEAARIEAERPDKEKLKVFGKGITSLMFSAPTVNAKRVQAKLDKVIALLSQAVDLIE